MNQKTYCAIQNAIHSGRDLKHLVKRARALANAIEHNSREGHVCHYFYHAARVTNRRGEIKRPQNCPTLTPEHLRFYADALETYEREHPQSRKRPEPTVVGLLRPF